MGRRALLKAMKAAEAIDLAQITERFTSLVQYNETYSALKLLRNEAPLGKYLAANDQVRGKAIERLHLLADSQHRHSFHQIHW